MYVSCFEYSLRGVFQTTHQWPDKQNPLTHQDCFNNFTQNYKILVKTTNVNRISGILRQNQFSIDISDICVPVWPIYFKFSQMQYLAYLPI